MTEQEAIAQTADRYRDEGYTVAFNPGPASLPAELRDRRPALLASRNGKSVIVEVWSRGRVNDLPPTFLPTGWEFDVVVIPQASGDGPVIPQEPQPTRDYVSKLLDELETCLPLAARRARSLLAWSAVEAAMRVVAREFGLDPRTATPRQLIRDLTTAGLIAQDQFTALQRQLELRDGLAHGLPVNALDAADVNAMVSLARELIASKPVPTA